MDEGRGEHQRLRRGGKHHGDGDLSNARSRLIAAVTALAVATALGPAAAPAVRAATRASLPADRLHFGLGNDPGQQAWFTASHVPWRYRYAYLAGGINNGGTPGDPCGSNNGWQTWNSPAGAYATYYMQNSAGIGTIPVFTYYEINQSNPSANNESAELTKVSNACLMQAYWADFTVLMQKAGAFGGPVVVHVEPDFWGFMEHQSSDPTTLPAVVASSGNPDLAGLPNNVAGMGLAFLKLRDKYAPNALLAIHASSWASGVDIASDTRTTVDPNAEADKVAAFLARAGIAGNPSGITPWDVVFNDVADHDSGYSGIWWDKTNAVFPDFARWLAFMGRLHADTGLPLVEWQVPVGNQYFDTMNDTAGHYQDNRAEYFIAHPDQLTAAGIVAVLFGKANANQTDYTDDVADGVTNPAPISTWQCNLCNNHISSVSDDDGGYLRMAVGAYYRTFPGTTCTMFPASSIFNTDVSTLPVESRSATWMGNMTQNADIHPDLGTFAQQYGIPINVAPPPSTGVTPSFAFDSESDHPTEGYPIDQTTLIEGGASAPSGSDRHALVIDKSRCKLYELYNLQNFTNGQAPQAGSGATWDLTSNAMRPAGWTSADAAGLPIAPLLLRPDEIQGGVIAHAIRFTAHCTDVAYTWPASHQAGSCGSTFPPMGARFRLKAGFDISGYSASTQVVLRAFQHYGLILADNGSDWYFQGTTDDWWGTSAGGQVVTDLKTVPASQFEAVDESGLQAAAGSYQALTAAAPCATPTLSASPPASQAAGSPVTVTASTSGCVNPQYRFFTRPAGGSWTLAQDYGPSATFNWTSTTPAGAYYIGVHVRAASSANAFDAFASMPYTLTTTRCGPVTLGASPPSPSVSGTRVTLTASTTGCPNPRYEFWMLPAGTATWRIVQGYSSSSSYSWNSTGALTGTEQFGVWARDAGSTNAYDAYTGIPYSVTAPACTSVTLSATPASPIAHGQGAHVTLTASASGCTNPNPVYEFWMLPAGSSVWVVVRGYTTGATYDWNTTGAPAGTARFGVWVRDAASTAAYDSFTGLDYTLN